MDFWNTFGNVRQTFNLQHELESIDISITYSSQQNEDGPEMSMSDV